MMLDDFSALKRNYWGQHLGGMGYAALRTGNITYEMLQEYLSHHKDDPDGD